MNKNYFYDVVDDYFEVSFENLLEAKKYIREYSDTLEGEIRLEKKTCIEDYFVTTDMWIYHRDKDKFEKVIVVFESKKMKLSEVI